MKSNTLIILFLLALNTVFSQEKMDSITKVKLKKWSIEIGTGISNGTRPYTKDYFSSDNNKLFNDFKLNCFSVGVKYNFSKIIGLKMDLAFDRFTNSKEARSKPFEVTQYRTSIQGIVNLNSLINPKKELSKFNLFFNTGLHLAMLKPIETDYSPVVSNGDNYGGFVLGITPTLQISKKMSLYFNFSSFSNYGQNLTWNGKHSDVSNNSNGHMISGTFGLSIILDKKQTL
jgi:OOP family OmpA-OmpF porin